jgi:hypothetical protein
MEGTLELLANGNGLSKTHADRVREALGNMYMGSAIDVNSNTLKR